MDYRHSAKIDFGDLDDPSFQAAASLVPDALSGTPCGVPVADYQREMPLDFIAHGERAQGDMQANLHDTPELPASPTMVVPSISPSSHPPLSWQDDGETATTVIEVGRVDSEQQLQGVSHSSCTPQAESGETTRAAVSAGGEEERVSLNSLHQMPLALSLEAHRSPLNSIAPAREPSRRRSSSLRAYRPPSTVLGEWTEDGGAMADPAAPERYRDEKLLGKPMTVEEEQQARLRAYDEMGGEPVIEFLRGTRDALVPDALTAAVGKSLQFVNNTILGAVPDPVGRAARATGEQVMKVAILTGTILDQTPNAIIGIIPEVVMSSEAKQLIFADFSRTLNSYFGTNILSIPFIFNMAGLVGGLILIVTVSCCSLYAVEAFFAAKNQLRDAHKVVMYGDVPRMTWGEWYPTLNVFFGVIRLIGFLTFAARNTEVILRTMGLTWGISFLSQVIPSILSLPFLFMKNSTNQRPLVVVSTTFILIAVVVMMTYFPYDKSDARLFPSSSSHFFTALGVTVNAFTGIGSAVPAERTMSPRRYIVLSRWAVGVSFAVLVTFGLSGYFSYGNYTCSVITTSLQPGSSRTAVCALLFVASVAIIPQVLFPLAEALDRRLLGLRHLPKYGEPVPNLMRIGCVVACGTVSYVVPYYGLIVAIGGAFGSGILGLVVPAGLDYVRRRRTALFHHRYMYWWEYLIVFSLGLLGLFVVIAGVSFGLFNLWLRIQTDSDDTC